MKRVSGRIGTWGECLHLTVRVEVYRFIYILGNGISGMRIVANKNIKMLFMAIVVIMTFLTVISQVTIYFIFRKISLVLLLFCILATVGVLLAVYCYFKKQDKILEDAESKIEAFLAGDIDARITNDEEGELYRLFSIFIACLWISWDDCINIRFQY